MIKLIASDLDGTILQNGAQTLPETLPPIIRKLQEKGIYYVSASGRQYANQLYLYGEELSNTMSFISDNGSMYVHNGTQHIFDSMDPDLVHRIILTCRDQEGCDISVSTSSTIYFETKNQTLLDHMEKKMKSSITIVDDLLEVEDTVIKMAVCNYDGIHQNDQVFKNLFSHECTVVTAGNAWLDFMPKNINKGRALKCLIEEMGILPEECMAFGDQYNDLEMLQLVGTSYAMANGAPGIAEHTTYTTDSVEKTLLEFLDKLS